MTQVYQGHWLLSQPETGHIIAAPFNNKLLENARNQNILLLPGVSSASEDLPAPGYGFAMRKLFPAQVVGGQSMLQSLAPRVSFCPTGSIGSDNYQDYLTVVNSKNSYQYWRDKCP